MAQGRLGALATPAAGALGRAIAERDWGATPLGPIADWPPTLLTTLAVLLPAQAQIVLFWGPDYRAFYNDAYAPTIGTKHPAALGEPARLYWAELWDDLGPLLDRVRDSGETFHARDRAFYLERHGYGETVYFDISYSAVRAPDGEVCGVLCIVSETTERLRRQNAIIEERNRVWEVSQDLLLVSDAEGVWQSVNPAWTRVLGWEAEELVGRTSEWIEHPDDIAKTRAEIARLAAGDLTIAFENRFRARDGGYRTLSWRAVPEGGIFYCVARDITDQRAQAEALDRAEAALRQAQKMETVGQLTGGIAHDFNNLLQIVMGNLETIERNLPDDAARLRRAAANALKGAERAAELTQRLLAFARRQPLNPRSVDVNGLVAGMSELLDHTLGEQISVETLVAPRLWHAEVDANQLENAILNLAVNARDAMPGGGRLTIETANVRIDPAQAAAQPEVAAGDYVSIRIADTGIGMDEATLARAFEPFFTTKEIGKGTGLGLSMVYGFARQSGGHVRVSSQPGEGVAVQLYLPRARGEPAHASGTRAPGAAIVPGGGHEALLVCEDDPDVRAFSAEMLRELGYRVAEAADAAAALALLRDPALHVDLLFTDVVLPGGMTGAELAQEARMIRPGLRILFTTGYARDAIVHHGRLDPGVELVTKPFTAAELAARVRAMLDGPAPAPAHTD